MDRNTLRDDIVFSVGLRGFDLTFRSTWGLFSPRAVDEGTGLLLDIIEVETAADCLDLGCGYGVIGTTLAKLAPLGRTTLVDKDFVAVDYAQKNIAANGINNAEVYLSNGYSNVPEDTRFDVVASNLPAKSGNELWSLLFEDTYYYLKPGGRIYVVTISNLKPFIKRTFLDVFGDYQKIKQGPRYTLHRADKK